MVSVFDGHCDVLFKMWMKKKRSLFFTSTDELHSSFERLKNGQVKVQTMAIYVPTETPKELRHYAALEMIDILYDEILAKDKQIKLLTDAKQLENLHSTGDQSLYILLSMEGAEPLYGDLTYLRTYYQLGVRSLGLTWNFRNEAADGVLEKNAGGLSNFGFELLTEMNRLHMSVDISHLAEKGFWDCVEHSTQPIMASHCNARALYDHPRNLYDQQIQAIYKMGGLIGVNFVPYFLTGDQKVTTTHVLNHVEHLLSLGGENHIGFGSDFDGISRTVHGLEHSATMPDFINLCQRHYSEAIIQKLFFDNWKDYYLTLWN